MPAHSLTLLISSLYRPIKTGRVGRRRCATYFKKQPTVNLATVTTKIKIPKHLFEKQEPEIALIIATH